MGDSGLWVLDTSNRLQYKVLGTAVASSDGAAHFVPLFDQFREIAGDSIRDMPVSLPPAFKTLVQCAHNLFKANDPHCDWYLEQALSPQALEQMKNGWYLPAIKALFDEGKADTGFTMTWPQMRNAFQSLLLRYGVNLLDSAMAPGNWLSRHKPELSYVEQ